MSTASGAWAALTTRSAASTVAMAGSYAWGS